MDAGECGYCCKWGHQGSRPPAATVEAVATVKQVHLSGGSEESFWIFAVSSPSGRNARISVDSGAAAHVCPTSFASATPLGPAKGGMLYDAQGHEIEAHGTRTVYMRLGPEGQSVGAQFRVMNVRTPILSMGKLVKPGCRFEPRPIGCKMSKDDRRCDARRFEKFSLGGRQRLHDDWRGSQC